MHLRAVGLSSRMLRECMHALHAPTQSVCSTASRAMPDFYGTHAHCLQVQRNKVQWRIES